MTDSAARPPRMWFINQSSIALPAYEGETSDNCTKAIEYDAYQALLAERDAIIEDLKSTEKTLDAAAADLDQERKAQDALLAERDEHKAERERFARYASKWPSVDAIIAERDQLLAIARDMADGLEYSDPIDGALTAFREWEKGRGCL